MLNDEMATKAITQIPKTIIDGTEIKDVITLFLVKVRIPTSCKNAENESVDPLLIFPALLSKVLITGKNLSIPDATIAGNEVIMNSPTAWNLYFFKAGEDLSIQYALGRVSIQRVEE